MVDVAEITTDCSWQYLIRYARASGLVSLVDDSAFVNVLFDKHDSRDHPDYANRIDLLTDMLHDAFDLSAEQRRVAYDHFLKRTMRLTHLYTMFEESHEQDVRARAKQT